MRKSHMLVQTVRSASPPRCRSEAQATLLAADTAVSSGGRSVQSGRGGQPSRSGDEAFSFIERSQPM